MNYTFSNTKRSLTLIKW